MTPDCDRVLPELVGYHFNAQDEGARRAVEAHLASCARCVRAFVEIKRAIELGEEAPATRAHVRAKLRRAVAAELGVERPWVWWERPLAIALAASFVLFAGATTRALTHVDTTPMPRVGGP